MGTELTGDQRIDIIMAYHYPLSWVRMAFLVAQFLGGFVLGLAFVVSESRGHFEDPPEAAGEPSHTVPT